MGTERRQSMGEQNFQEQFRQEFENRSRVLQDEENTYMRDTFETNEIQRHLQANDEKSERLHHSAEKEYYRQLSEDGGVSVELTSFAERQSLVPKINDTGMSKKRKEKLKKRTKTSYEEGRKLVGEYATAQTIPLMKSLRKNGVALKKQREKKKEDEKADIIALSDMVIPADLFELEITEKHSHFDVKKALKIKDALERIEKYKAANSFEYFMFDNDVQARLDALLLHKPIFERTLTVALAANGVSLEREGEKLKEDDIKKARKEYYGVTEAYKEKMADFQSTVDAVKAQTRVMVKNQQQVQARFRSRKGAIRDKILADWESFNDPDFSFVDKTKSVPGSFIKKQGNGYDRSLFRMTEGGSDAASQEEARQASYKALKMSMLSEKLVVEGPQPAENHEMLRQYKELVMPYCEGYKQKGPKMLEFLKNASSIEDMLTRYDELVELELGYQSFMDYLKVTDTDGRTLKETLFESKFDYKLMSNTMVLVSDFRKTLDALLVLKRLSYEDIRYEELSANVVNVTEMKVGKNITPLLKTNDEDRIQQLKKALLLLQKNLNGNEEGIVNFWTQDSKKIADRIRLDTEIEEEKKALDKDGMTIVDRQSEEYSALIETSFSAQKSEEKKATIIVDVSEIKRMYKASGLKTKGSYGASEEGGKELEFNRSLRELFGNPSYEEGPNLAKISVEDVKFEDFSQIFKKTQVPSETGDGSTEKVEVDRDALMNLLKPVLEFEPDKYWKGVSRDVFSSMKSRHEFADKMYKDLHRFTALTQWTDAMDLVPYLGEYVIKKINQKRDMFVAITKYVAKIDNPGVTEKEFFDREIPLFSEAVEATIHREELEAKRNDAVSEYMQAHPQVGYDRVRLSKFGYGGPQDGFYGRTVERDNKIILPLSEEELGKIENVDGEFIKQLGSEISEFSLITQIGRRRVLFDDSVKDLMETGKEDLKYYAEFDRKARMIAMASVLDKEGVKKALGDKADEVLKTGERIMGIYRSLEGKMNDSQTDWSLLRETMEKTGGGTVEEIKLAREAERKPLEDVAVSKKKTWDLGIRGVSFSW